MPVGIEVEDFTDRFEANHEPVVMFCGVMNYALNEEGVRWFAEHVWPRVRAARPDARFTIVGSDPTNAVKALASRDMSIEVVGRVPAVQPYLWKSAVSVAPLRLATGQQTKVLEALAAGLPVVVASAVFAGLPPEAQAGCVRADEPGDFAEAVLRLLAASPDDRRRHAARAQFDSLRWPELTRPLERILRDASATGAGT